MLWFVLLGCPFVGDEVYSERVLDLDGDGLAALSLGGLDCRDDDPAIGRCDDDGDGFDGVRVGGRDCDDTDASVNPDAPEVCNGRDDDCDGLVDEPNADAPVWFADDDSDGFGAGEAVSACEMPLGHVQRSGDCDDTDAATRPDAVESCDAVDRDCDGDPVANADDTVRWYEDSDGDGVGGDTFVQTCSAPGDGYVAITGDCDDSDALTRLPATWFLDADADGFGDASQAVVVACQPPIGYTGASGDCADDDPSVSPAIVEICNGIDDDCSGSVDDTSDGTLFFADNDGDGFGDGVAIRACVAPTGTVPNDDDCNDVDATVNPAALEVCGDSVRQDCRAFPPDDCDADGVLDADDCGDEDPSVFPGAVEICNGRDDNCDGLVDDADPDRMGAEAFYADQDGDGVGAGDAVFACEAPLGWVSDSGDCDDAEDAVLPGAPERCDAVDNDCNGQVDDDAVDRPTWYPDADGDGAGDLVGGVVATCAPPAAIGWVREGTDCDDTRASIGPDADERCNLIDDDCDGLVDEQPVDGAPYHRDADGDGFGAGDPVLACVASIGLVASATDCNDASGSVYPGAPEVCGDTVRQDCSAAPIDDCDGDGTTDLLDCGIEDPERYPGAPEICNGLDDDCDGDVDSADADVDLATTTTWYLDLDGDGVGDGSPVLSCDQPANTSLLDGDCDDVDPDIRPGVQERCDGIDNDCDGSVDLGEVLQPPTFFRDDDGDGFGDPDVFSTDGCFAPAGAWVDVAMDCDDTAFDVSPLAVERCNGVDDDCDGDTDDADGDVVGEPWYRDGDGDGAGVASDVVRQCAAPAGRVPAGSGFDCADANADRFPGAPERCNGVDDDCDGVDDLADPDLVDPSSWWPDLDGDGFGDRGASPERQCTPPSGFVGNDDDCADDDSTRNPGATEVCDGAFDNDCNGLADDADPQLSPAGAPVWFVDGDGDGRGGVVTVRQCLQPSGTVAIGDDCNDADPLVGPGRGERCNGVDDDCDGAVDEYLDAAPLDGLPWFVDADGDGFTTGAPLIACSAPPGSAAASVMADCDDADVDVFPGALEVWYDGVDQNCDGENDYDQDGDGLSWDLYPDQRLPYDCVDTDPAINAFADEVWYDGVDQACDGGDDYDQDGDGFSLVDDCNDRRPYINPGVTEYWYDGIDDNCDGADDYDQDGDGDARIPEGTDCDDRDATIDGLERTVGVEYLTVQEAVDAACPGTIVNLPGGVLEETVVLDTSVEIRGANTTWRPGGLNQGIATIEDPSTEVRISDVQFEAGRDLRGGCVRVEDGKATFEHVNFVDCTASQEGGALYGGFADITLLDVQMIGNTAGGRGGAIYAPNGRLEAHGLVVRDGAAGEGGGLYLHFGSDVELHQAVFQDNLGAGQIANENGSTFLMEDSLVRGGEIGILARERDASFTVHRTRIEGAHVHGVHVFQDAEFRAFDTVFVGNGVVAGGTSLNNFGGGGLLVEDAGASLTRVTFVGNQTTVGDGAALYIRNDSTLLNQVLFVNNGTSSQVDVVVDVASGLLTPDCTDCGADLSADLSSGGSFPGLVTGSGLQLRSTSGSVSTWDVSLRNASVFRGPPLKGACTNATDQAWCTP